MGKLICFCSMNQFLKWFYLFLHYSKIGACKQENLAKWHSKNIFCTHSGWSILFTCLIWINCLCASCFENVHTCINTMKKNAVSLHCWDLGVTPFITIYILLTELTGDLIYFLLVRVLFCLCTIWALKYQDGKDS